MVEKRYGLYFGPALRKAPANGCETATDRDDHETATANGHDGPREGDTDRDHDQRPACGCVDRDPPIRRAREGPAYPAPGGAGVLTTGHQT